MKKSSLSQVNNFLVGKPAIRPMPSIEEVSQARISSGQGVRGLHLRLLLLGTILESRNLEIQMQLQKTSRREMKLTNRIEPVPKK